VDKAEGHIIAEWPIHEISFDIQRGIWMLLAAFLIEMPRGRWHGETRVSAAAKHSMSRDTYHVVVASMWGGSILCHQADYRRELLIVWDPYFQA
jgi:hypothetical protein